MSKKRLSDAEELARLLTYLDPKANCPKRVPSVSLPRSTHKAKTRKVRK